MRLIAYFSLFFHIVTVSGQAQNQDLTRLAKAKAITEVDIMSVNNRIVVKATAGPYDLHLVLDTGATKTALFQSEDMTYSELETAGKAEIMFPALDEKVTGTRLAPFDIKIGTMTYRPQKPLMILKRPPIGDRLNFAFDGVLGQDFFMHYVVEVDPHDEVMRVYARDTDLSDNYPVQLNLRLHGTTPYIDFYHPLPWERSHIRLRDPTTRKSMLLDTGYPGVMVVWNAAHFKKIVSDKRAKELRDSNTGIFTRSTLRLGKVKFHNIPIFLAPRVPAQASERDGIIGSNLIHRFKYAIDFQGERVLLDRGNYRLKYIDGAFYVPNNEDYIYKIFSAYDKRGNVSVAGTRPE